MRDIEKRMLTQLQRGIEIIPRPFQTLESSETEVLDLLKRAQTEGLLRRFGGIFDARRLGYKSILCALDVPPKQIEKKAAVIAAHPGVTHCYERTPVFSDRNYPALWFTLAMLHDEFDAGVVDLRSKLETGSSKLFLLPALRRFKIDVVFDLSTRNRDEAFPGCEIAEAEDRSFPVFSAEEKSLIRLLDQQIPLVARPFAAVAEQIGLTEEFVLSVLQDWKKQGILRRIGAILYHRQAGFKANAMCVWPLTGDPVEAGRRVAARPEVTHCYQRPHLDVFPFDLYAMIHTATWDETKALFQDISSGCGLDGGELFASGREFKKSSMKYFR